MLTRGGRKKNRENDVHLRQLANKSTHVPTFFNISNSAFLGVSRQGDFENTGGGNEYVSKKNTGEIFFPGGIFFSDELSFDSFYFDFLCCVG
jgi:hypothetical protein